MPALVIREIIIKTGASLAHGVVQTAGASKNKTDPVAWAIKYLQAAFVLSVKGPKA